MGYLDWTGFDITDPANTKRFNLGAGDIRSAKSDLKDRIDILDGILYNSTVGVIFPYFGLSTPTGFLLCDGSSVSRTTYSTLFGVISSSLGTFTVTIATPGVVSLASHGLVTGDCISMTTTGALPTGLSADTNYYVIYVTADTFQVATSYANAYAGTAIGTTGTQSGTHSLRHNPFGINGSGNFYLPNCQGVSFTGTGSQDINGRTKTGPALGEVREDRGQMFQIGVSNDGTGDINYYGIGADRGYASSQTSVANHATPRFMTTTQGDARMMKAMNDGTNGDFRGGLYGRPNEVGVKYIIKY